MATSSSFTAMDIGQEKPWPELSSNGRKHSQQVKYPASMSETLWTTPLDCQKEPKNKSLEDRTQAKVQQTNPKSTYHSNLGT